MVAHGGLQIWMLRLQAGRRSGGARPAGDSASGAAGAGDDVGRAPVRGEPPLASSLVAGKVSLLGSCRSVPGSLRVSQHCFAVNPISMLRSLRKKMG